MPEHRAWPERVFALIGRHVHGGDLRRRHLLPPRSLVLRRLRLPDPGHQSETVFHLRGGGGEVGVRALGHEDAQLPAGLLDTTLS